MGKSLYRRMVDLDGLIALIDRCCDLAESAGETEREVPEAVVRAADLAKQEVTALADTFLHATERAIKDAKRPTDVGRFTLQAIGHCFRTGKQVPEPIQKSFVHIYENEASYSSWDRAFGKPRGRRANVFEQLKDIERLVHEARGNRPIDNDLFEEIGRKLGVGGSTKVKSLYSALKDGKKAQ
jgi:hypothetical protein